MSKLKGWSKKALQAAQLPPDHDLTSIVDDLRAKNHLGGRAGEQTCSRADLGEDLYERLHRVCARLDFFGRFDRDTLVRCVAPASSRFAAPLVRNTRAHVLTWRAARRSTFSHVPPCTSAGHRRSSLRSTNPQIPCL